MFLNCVHQLHWSLGRQFPELYFSCLTITMILVSTRDLNIFSSLHSTHSKPRLLPHLEPLTAHLPALSWFLHVTPSTTWSIRPQPLPSTSQLIQTSFSAWRHKRSNSTRPVALAVPAHWRVNGCWFCSSRRHVVAVLPVRGRCESLVMDGKLWGGGGGGSAEGKHLHANNRICLLATHTDCINVQSRVHR